MMFLSTTEQCPHAKASLHVAIVYSLTLSVAFVGSLYLLVPTRVRCLHRDNPQQIFWRTIATLTVAVGGLISYYYTFCVDEVAAKEYTYTALPLLSRSQPNAFVSAGLLSVHIMTLYLGPLVQNFVETIVMIKRDKANVDTDDYVRALFARYCSFQCLHGQSILSPSGRKWVNLRNYIFAPVVEEVVFRGCIVSALSLTRISSWHICATAPLFFGLAHIHHGWLKLNDGMILKHIVLQTTLQFAYTYIFGMYTSFAFLKTRSIVAIILSHSYCNYMGLPTLEFTKQSSMLHRYRHALWLAHLLGICGFSSIFFTLSIFQSHNQHIRAREH